MTDFIQFNKSNTGWRFEIPKVGASGIVDKDIITKYIEPQADHVYSKQYILRKAVNVEGFGELFADIEVWHDNNGNINTVYVSIGDRNKEALEVVESFRLPLTE